VWKLIELQGTRFWMFRALISSGWEHRTAGDVLLARYGGYAGYQKQQLRVRVRVMW
jgi:hypothetical protein